jgi:hypothetical protein
VAAEKGEGVSGSEVDLRSTLAMVFFGSLWLIWMGRLFWAMSTPLRRRDRKPQADRLSLSDVQFLRGLHVEPWGHCSGPTRTAGDETFRMPNHDW